jgi:hypothetical protein
MRVPINIAVSSEHDQRARSQFYQFLCVFALALPYDTGKSTLLTTGDKLMCTVVKNSHATTTMSAKSGNARRPYVVASGRARSRMFCRISGIMTGVW